MKTALALALALAGCYGPDFSQSCFSCVESASCPAGQACVAGRCEGGSCPPSPAPTCANTLSGVEAADFGVAFKIKTTLRAAADVMSQRWTCDGTRDYFDVLLTLRGTLVFEVVRGESGNYDGLEAAGVVNDGRQHAVAARRMGGTQTDTVWTWNAIGRRAGAVNLDIQDAVVQLKLNTGLSRNGFQPAQAPAAWSCSCPCTTGYAPM